MTAYGFSLFETTIGTCGIVWTARGISGVQLPEATEGATRGRVLRCFAGAAEMPPTAHVQRAVDGIVALLRGESVDLTGVTIDNEDTRDLDDRVYAVARTIS